MLFGFAKHKNRKHKPVSKRRSKKEHELFKNKIIAKNLFDNRANLICYHREIIQSFTLLPLDIALHQGFFYILGFLALVCFFFVCVAFSAVFFVLLFLPLPLCYHKMSELFSTGIFISRLLILKSKIPVKLIIYCRLSNKGYSLIFFSRMLIFLRQMWERRFFWIVNLLFHLVTKKISNEYISGPKCCYSQRTSRQLIFNDRVINNFFWFCWSCR